MTGNSIVMTEMLLLLFRLLRVSFLSPRVLNFLFILLRGAPKIDLPLFMFLLAKSVLTSLFSISTLLLVEVILEEEKPYPKLVQSEVGF